MSPTLPPPDALPVTNSEQSAWLSLARSTVADIIDGRDSRLLIILGPCSIHDLDAARVYALELKTFQERYGQQLFLVMRNYFAKPRSVLGWKGWVYDPHLDGSFDMYSGLVQSQQWLSDLAQMRVPVAVELLDPFVVPYWQPWITWGAIGARTAESQTHRELASAMPFPVGFKNNTQGHTGVALDGMLAARQAQPRFTINGEGRACFERTEGNRHVHLVLRGGQGHNYTWPHVAKVLEQVSDPSYVMVDCSHGNAGEGQQANQARVAAYWIDHLNRLPYRVGLMLESFLEPGRQVLDSGNLRFGQSITDPCLGLTQTDELLARLAEAHARLLPQQEHQFS